jgi:hypothetical protein
MVFESRMQRGIFVPNRNDFIEEERRLHTELLYDLHSSPNIWVIK